MTEQAPLSNFAQQAARLSEPLPEDMVEYRVQSISASGWATILAYKNARVDMDRLDQIFGVGYWQRFHKEIHGKEFCRIEIWNSDLRQWVGVEDCGVPSNSDGAKGESSDAFKRAGFNLGIGRELYDMPLILVQLQAHEFETYEEKGKKRAKATYGLKLKDWIFKCVRGEQDDTGRCPVKRLDAFDEKGNKRYSYEKGTSMRASSQNQQPAGAGNSTAGGSTEKQWFNDFEAHKNWFIEQFQKGYKADAIINKLKERFRLNKATEKNIRDLAAANYKAGTGGDMGDDIPF